MKTPTIRIDTEIPEAFSWDVAPPPRYEDEELNILAYELWQEGCCAKEKVKANEAVLVAAVG